MPRVSLSEFVDNDELQRLEVENFAQLTDKPEFIGMLSEGTEERLQQSCDKQGEQSEEQKAQEVSKWINQQLCSQNQSCK